MAQESIDIILACLVKSIQAFQKQIKILDQAIEDLVVILPEYQCLRSIPGIGPVYAAGLLAEIGQIERFEDQAKLAKIRRVNLESFAIRKFPIGTNTAN